MNFVGAACENAFTFDDDSPVKQPSCTAVAKMETLRARAALLAKIRDFFDSRDFIEVQTPVLSRETIVDRYIDPIRVEAAELQLPKTEGVSHYFLQSSPEFAMKRLLASGAMAIYQIGPAFRAGESGALHNPEFTILEWYRVGDSVDDGIQLLGEFARHMFSADRFEVITYQDAFVQQAAIDPLADFDIAAETQRLGLPVTATGRDEWLDIVLDAHVAPRLGAACPTVLSGYPKSQAALAQVSERDPRTSERFELFVEGVELANGYGELTDAEVLAQRMRQANRERSCDQRAALPEPQLIVDAMRHGLPECSGCAVGVDRLVQKVLGLESIDQVMPFPIRNA